VLYVVIRDESGSLRLFRQAQGTFLPQVHQHVVDQGGPRVADLVYVLFVVISGGVVLTEFVPLSQATDPEFIPDGQTPLGQALALTTDKIVTFLETEVFPQETAVKAFEILISSDLMASGETAATTEEGMQKFLQMATKYHAAVTLLAPDEQSVNADVARQLDVSNRGVRYLNSDPKGILTVTFDSILGASRKLGGSNPVVRNR
jgi:hypothetical protein